MISELPNTSSLHIHFILHIYFSVNVHPNCSFKTAHVFEMGTYKCLRILEILQINIASVGFPFEMSFITFLQNAQEAVIQLEQSEVCATNKQELVIVEMDGQVLVVKNILVRSIHALFMNILNQAVRGILIY